VGILEQIIATTQFRQLLQVEQIVSAAVDDMTNGGCETVATLESVTN